MTKYRVSDLDGDLLDAAVATVAGMPFKREHGHVSVHHPYFRIFTPSSDWLWAAQFITFAKISLQPNANGADEWLCTCQGQHAGRGQHQHPLVAAMRAFVTSKLGEEVDL